MSKTNDLVTIDAAKFDELKRACLDGSPHMVPVIEASRAFGLVMQFPPQGPDRFPLPPADRTFIAVVGDDPPEPGKALGPTGFERKSLRRLIRATHACMIVAAEADVDLLRWLLMLA